MKDFLLISIISLLVAQEGYSQENLQKHIIQKGEDPKQIAQKYKVTPNDLYKANPSLLNGFKEKDTLVIPKSMVAAYPATPKSTTKPAQNIPEEIVYVVQSKETKFGLSKQFGLSIEEIEAQNPHIINGLQSGHVIRIKGAKQNIPYLRAAPSVQYGKTVTYTVLPGETLYGIAKRNQLTVDELVAVNKDNLSGILKSGQTLNIPSKKEIVYSDEVHVVQAGETKYGLSKRYGVSIPQLESLNPHITRMLQTGQRLQLPATKKSTTTAVAQQPKVTAPVEQVPTASVVEVEPKMEHPTTVSETPKVTVEVPADWVDYTIQPGETLFGLSRKSGVSIKELTEVNPKLIEVGVQAEMVIKMPKQLADENEVTTIIPVVPTPEPSVSSSKNTTLVTNTVGTTSSQYQVRYTDLAKTISKIEKKQLVIFAPFNETAFKALSQKPYASVTDEVAFYQGVLRAIDSARVVGVNFDYSLIEAQNDKNGNQIVASLKALKTKPNAVLMPYYDREVSSVVSHLQKENIPVITTSDILEEKEYNNRFCAVPSIEAQVQKMLSYIQSKNGNVIVISDFNRTEMTESILASIPRAKLVTTSERGVLDVENLKYQLLSDRKNYIILNTNKNGTIITATNALLSELSKHSIELAFLESDLMPDVEDVSAKRFAVLQLMYPSTISPNRSGFATSFVEQFKRSNQIAPSQSYLNGFDLTFDTLLRMAQQKNFEATAKDDISEQTSIKFEYTKNEKGSYSNQGIYILQYGNDSVVKEIK
jgi:LysM repeat protein